MTVLRDYATALAQPTLALTPGTAAALRYDEVIGPDGVLRPAWKSLAGAAAALTPDELRRVDGEISTFLADDGVTYGHPVEGVRPWRLDAVPLVLDAAAWARLEAGLAQRAELLSAVLADLYGAQELLSSGTIPAPVVFGHAGYVRAAARPRSADRDPLILAGADLGRDAAGEWRVLADRVQAPSGLGYAMENRRVISRVLPDLYQGADLHRMEPYFTALRAALLGAAPEGVADPRVVVLSPGTHSETAYDQAFLATALGFPLVQGSDLVVRDGWVWMKPARWPSAAPVERVDVILRRVDAEWCDPLELRGNSRLGVAGLAEAARRGRVRLANGLGAGVLENPALLPFLPQVCERLLGEQLRLGAIPTWWLGDPDGLAEVLPRIGDDDLIVRAIDGRRTALTGLPADELRAQVLAAPHRYVGQQRLPLSQAPVWSEHGGADPRRLVLRTFTLRHGSSYRPLVGGLASALGDGAGADISKDVWVLKALPSDPDQGLVEVAPVSLARSVPVLAPRALEDMFWSGRYAERAEDLLRLVVATHAHAEQLGDRGGEAGDRALAVVRRGLQRLAGQRWADVDEELRSLLLDADRAGSAAQSLTRLRETLEGVRDQLSGDTWRAFTVTDKALKTLRSTPSAPQTAESAGRMLTGILSLQGVSASMIRDAGWHMMEAGRFVERSLQVVSLLASTGAERRGVAVDRAVLGVVLAASESSVTYRRRYLGNVRTAGVLELLLRDDENPRSLRFSLAQVRAHLSAMPASTGSTRPERLLEQLEETVDALNVTALTAPGDAKRPVLQSLLDDTWTQLAQLAEAIEQLHFAAGPAPQSLTSLSLIEMSEALA